MSLLRHPGIRPLCRTCLPRIYPVSVRRFTPSVQLSKKFERQQPFQSSTGDRDSRPFRRGGQRHGTNNLKLPRTPTKMRPSSLARVILDRLPEWRESDRVNDRLEACGFTQQEADECLDNWIAQTTKELNAVDKEDESFINRMNELAWDARGMILAYEAGSFGNVFEAAFLRHFLSHASVHGPEHLRLHLRSLLRATDISGMAQDHISARSLNRKFHLHMGPTNSGKTYNALKALSRAGSGVYAGPLRLLAHEVWERMNLGSVGDLEGQGRPCNLLTGEERRLVQPDAGLVSCTVEMLPLAGYNGEPWDVVVVDEIQMLGDTQRGGAWTNAVVGVNAKEIHLCGDETTADLLRSMIDSFKGDSLEIHRYDRLTPLSVAEESLDGDWNKVQPGDCVVTFSRSNVFSVKKMVEGALGKKCAVVYGALPPETRAEQARDFNEETGRAEVLVASDAVGMGLNLKIGRIIFESLTKYDGKKDVPLSLSQVKQIAGRAGRFGQQRKSESTTTDEVSVPGGIVTTLHAADLPLLRHMLPLSLPPVTRAVVEVPHAALAALAPLLPPDASFADLVDHFTAMVKLPPNSVMGETAHRLPLADIVEPFRDVLTLSETDVFCKAPVNHRDAKVAGIYENIVSAYSDSFLVSIEDVLESSTLLNTLQTVEETLAALPPMPTQVGNFRPPPSPPITISAIPLLESLHKSLVLYIWLSYRLELAFPDRELATLYKERTERVLEICLERMPGVRTKKSHERTKEGDREQGLYRRKHVDKHGLAKPDIKWVEREVSERQSMKARWGNASNVAGGFGHESKQARVERK